MTSHVHRRSSSAGNTRSAKIWYSNLVPVHNCYRHERKLTVFIKGCIHTHSPRPKRRILHINAKWAVSVVATVFVHRFWSITKLNITRRPSDISTGSMLRDHHVLYTLGFGFHFAVSYTNCIEDSNKGTFTCNELVKFHREPDVRGIEFRHAPELRQYTDSISIKAKIYASFCCCNDKNIFIEGNVARSWEIFSVLYGNFL